MNDWNNDLSDYKEPRELCDHDFEIEEENEKPPHVYSPFSPYYNGNEIKAPSIKDLFECLNTNKP